MILGCVLSFSSFLFTLNSVSLYNTRPLALTVILHELIPWLKSACLIFPVPDDSRSWNGGENPVTAGKCLSSLIPASSLQSDGDGKAGWVFVGVTPGSPVLPCPRSALSSVLGCTSFLLLRALCLATRNTWGGDDVFALKSEPLACTEPLTTVACALSLSVGGGYCFSFFLSVDFRGTFCTEGREAWISRCGTECLRTPRPPLSSFIVSDWRWAEEVTKGQILLRITTVPLLPFCSRFTCSLMFTCSFFASSIQKSGDFLTFKAKHLGCIGSLTKIFALSFSSCIMYFVLFESLEISLRGDTVYFNSCASDDFLRHNGGRQDLRAPCFSFSPLFNVNWGRQSPVRTSSSSLFLSCACPRFSLLFVGSSLVWGLWLPGLLGTCGSGNSFALELVSLEYLI